MTTERFHPNLNSTHRPWQLVLLLPNCQHRLIAEFCHRQDAEDHWRSLKRLAPQVHFSLMFVPPTD
jgi:hypothetical protein